MIIRIDENIAINTEDIVMVERVHLDHTIEMRRVLTNITLRERPKSISVLGDIFDKVVDACNGVKQ